MKTRLTSVGPLHSAPLQIYTLEFFASPASHASGYGEGQWFLGSATVVIDAAGNAPFDVAMLGKIPSGWVITSTATLEPLGRTSEFSAAVPIERIKGGLLHGGGWNGGG